MTDRIKGALLALLRLETARLDFFALYGGTCTKDNGDGTVEVKIDGDRIPGLSRIPVRLGVPGVTVEVERGARVLVGFEDGKPSRPYATMWQGATLKTITVKASATVRIDAPEVALGDGAKPVACVGDAVDIPLLPGPVSVTGTLDGAPFAGILILTDILVGQITNAQTRTKA